MHEKQVYEAVCIRDGTEDDKGTGIILECDSFEEAMALSEDYATKLETRIKLYSVPEVNETHVPSSYLWPDDFKLVADIPKPSAA